MLSPAADFVHFFQLNVAAAGLKEKRSGCTINQNYQAELTVDPLLSFYFYFFKFLCAIKCQDSCCMHGSIPMLRYKLLYLSKVLRAHSDKFGCTVITAKNDQ